MSKGTQVYSIRIPSALSTEIWTTINNRNLLTKDGPWNFTDFILKAVREKLDHMKRSRSKKKREIAEPTQTPIPSDGVIHPHVNELPEWENIRRELEEEEREAMDGTD